MTRRRRWNRSSIPALLIISLILLFSGVLLREGRLRDQDLARLGSLEAAAAVAEAMSAGEEPVLGDPAVEGWGVYSQEGTRIAGGGSAPNRLEAPRSGPAVSERFADGRLRSVRTMVAARPEEPGTRRGGGGPAGFGGGMRRLVLIDWNLRAGSRRVLLRATGVAGLLILTVLMLVMQQRSARRLADYQKEEERRRRLVQLGMAARTLTHEIRNPLGTIKAQGALLRRTLPPHAAEGLRIIDAEVDRLSALTDRVRRWLADPRGAPERFIVDERIRDIAGSSPWNPAFDGAAGTAAVMMDPHLFDTVLLNLMRNAAESSDDMPSAEAFRIATAAGKTNIRIDIEDRGRGLPPLDTEKLFDPFFTTKTQGSGVGLALARQAVEAAGGRLTLENRPGGGTRARIILPGENS